MVESGRRRRTKEEEAVMVVLLGLCILSCLLTPVRGATDQSDASALWNMYSSLNNAAQLTKWIANGGDPCGESWKGITCSNSRVTQIKLPGLGLTGSIGFQLGSLTSLTELDVSNNNLAGQIPYSLPPSVQRLNLANNNFNGDIPYSISQMTSLKYLDLSFNSLTGNLPRSFSSLSSMTTMYLQNNQFSGDINVLANLPLDTLNIANNHFTGWIPEQLKGIHLQRDGNSFSSGPAPPPPPGTPPITKSNRNHRSGSNNSPSDSDNGGGGKKSGIGGGGIAGIIISLLVVGGIIAFFLVKRRSKRSSPDIEKFDNQPLAPLASNDMHEMKSVQTAPAINTKTFDTSASITLKPPPIDRHKSFDEEDFPKKPVVVKKPVKIPVNVTSYSVADLQMATGSFGIENLLGEGTFGRVYRAHFDDGKVVAVKKLDSSAIPSEFSDEFPEMVSNISELHHTNVTELVGYCAEHGQHILIYEFHKNGSLYDFFHLSDEYSKPLTWNTRVKIALGTARALEYLHEVCSPSIVHKNIKSANILLDSELNPHLSDSGLASFLPNAEQALSQNAGLGYSAPEVTMSGQYTLKSDVYSFGVVMLELLTGRKPFDSSRPRSEQSLVRWATPQLHDIDALSKMVDPDLKGLYPVKSLSRFADVIALCVQAEPEFRPPMSEVVQALVRLVQRSNMSKRTFGNDQRAAQQSDDLDM
ncbi:hypothetical protein CDL15_Pgr013738 [Punica granatum]|uniref:Protein kinase domain-containing protein n=1 Tax=Punica granatum TaxID=22663 RepID=A0A218W2Q8_PUNGR|nr:hypothetical protein CDL15_Pgr013738 [Punica granatum]